MKSSDSIGALSAALAAAQAEMTNPIKEALNPHFKSRYADLPAIVDAVRGPLTKHGIAFIQVTRMDANVLMVETVLAHAESGEWISSESPVIELPATQQAIGSALTYQKRYQLAAMCGVAGDSPDDDGNEASKKAVISTKMSRAESSDYLAALKEELLLIQTLEDLDRWSKEVKDINRLLDDDYRVLGSTYKARRKELENGQG